MLHRGNARSTQEARKAGFTLIELLVVIAIIAILAAILFPVFATAKVSANRSACMAHLKQLGNALDLYRQSFNGCYPSTIDYADGGHLSPQLPWGHATWAKRLSDGFTKSINVFRCPGAANPLEVQTLDGNIVKLSYSYNEFIWYGIHYGRGDPNRYPWYKESAIRYPKYLLLIADGHDRSLVHDWDSDDSELTDWAKLEGLPEGFLRVKYAEGILRAGGAPQERHGGSNILFGDGHVKTLLKKQYKYGSAGYRQFPVIWPNARPYL